ncbi:hypothetical protein NE237_015537 [Protea cynaroides]|uniref:Acid phosphatase n=1 Tax=Protea cynaroides TaxID=273540 RepID=A0A9Q0KEH4_9MAGN|nr:hypothetical protein NE237_015537 [Protea cynaroides]
MGRNLGLLLGFCSLIVGVAVADWNILNQRIVENKNGLKITLKNYCEAWRINVELHNIRQFEVVPEECTEYIEKALEECTNYLSNTFELTGDDKDGWIFDVDDTILSTIPYFKKHTHGMVREGNAPALDHTMNLFNYIKGKGIKIFLVSSRGYNEDNGKTVQQYKAEQRKYIPDEEYRLERRDQNDWSTSLLGLPEAMRSFKLPNAVYYIP